MASWARRFPILAFLIIGFGVPWAGWWLRSLLFADQPLDRAQWPLGSWALYYTGGGLLLGAVVMTALLYGRAGLGDLAARMVRFRVPPGWFAFALLAPILYTIAAVYIASALTGRPVGPFQPWEILRLFTPAVLFIFTIGPLCEEAGWRGFLLPHLEEAGLTPFAASLLIGVLWTMWHYPLSFMPNFFDQFQNPIGWAYYLVLVTSFSLHFTILYMLTNQSIMMAMIMHWTINASGEIMSSIFPQLSSAADAEGGSGAGTAVFQAVNLGIWILSAVTLVAIHRQTFFRRQASHSLSGHFAINRRSTTE